MATAVTATAAGPSQQPQGVAVVELRREHQNRLAETEALPREVPAGSRSNDGSGGRSVRNNW